MTIDQHLEFSVLSAPLASFDRRALSQAWYSALYAAHQPAQRPQKPPMRAPIASTTHAQVPASASRAPARPEPGPYRARGPAKRGAIAPKGAEPERRGARTALARAIVRKFHGRAFSPCKTTVAIEDSGYRVHVMLAPRGNRLELIAICAERATAQVSAALGEARYALRRRGVALDAALRTQASC